MAAAASPVTLPKADIDPLSTLKDFLFQDMVKVDQVIDQFLESSVPLISTMGRHLIQAGGKRLRPLLTVACCRLFDKVGEAVLSLAAAVEFIHTATLLHDDVIDASALRRGLPTANAIWGNQASVLVGDFLFSRSFQLMMKTNNSHVLAVLADASARISEGEVLQLSLCHNLEASINDCLRVVEAKTATLFAASCEVGGLMAHQKEAAPALRAYGQNLGMAFQIVDDILDYCSQTPQFGKEAGDDFREAKITLPVILAYSACQGAEKDFLRQMFVDQCHNAEDFPRVLQIIETHGGFSKAYDLASTYAKAACQALSPLPKCAIKGLLGEVAGYSLKRQC